MLTLILALGWPAISLVTMALACICILRWERAMHRRFLARLDAGRSAAAPGER